LILYCIFLSWDTYIGRQMSAVTKQNNILKEFWK
jgi:hypothetical protein